MMRFLPQPRLFVDALEQHIIAYTSGSRDALSTAEQRPALSGKASLQCMCYNCHARCYSLTSENSAAVELEVHPSPKVSLAMK